MFGTGSYVRTLCAQFPPLPRSHIWSQVALCCAARSSGHVWSHSRLFHHDMMHSTSLITVKLLDIFLRLAHAYYIVFPSKGTRSIYIRRFLRATSGGKAMIAERTD